jgi:hypothetical protein
MHQSRPRVLDPETMKTPRAGIVVRLRSANRPSSSGCVHGTTIQGLGCGCRLGRQTTHVQRFAGRHRLPSNLPFSRQPRDVFAHGHTVSPGRQPAIFFTNSMPLAIALRLPGIRFFRLTT